MKNYIIEVDGVVSYSTDNLEFAVKAATHIMHLHPDAHVTVCRQLQEMPFSRIFWNQEGHEEMMPATGNEVLFWSPELGDYWRNEFVSNDGYYYYG